MNYNIVYIVFFYFILSIVNVNATVIDVIGIGKNFEEAKKDAFSNAIKNTFGTLIVSEMEVINNTLTKDNIESYSSGYIKDFTINDVKIINFMTHVHMSVTVDSTNLQNNILSSSKSPNGERFFVQFQSHDESKKDALSLIQSLFNSYPSKAFDIEVTSTDLINVDSKKVAIVAYYNLKWNELWIQKFKDILHSTREKNVKTSNSLMTFMIEKSQHSIIQYNNWDLSYMSDKELIFSIRKLFNINKPYAKLSFYNDNTLLDVTCSALAIDHFINTDTVFERFNAFKIYTFKTIQDSVGLAFNKKNSIIKNINNIKVEVVNKQHC